MKTASLIISLLLTVTVVVALSFPFGSVPPLGEFLSPQHGFWLNAEPTDKNFSADLEFTDLEGHTDVYFDDRMVPHVFAETEGDAWFVQGFLHARFRLWQMEFQTHAAAGRLSEVLGPGPDSAYLNNDRNMRRVGMVYGARQSLKQMERDSATFRQIMSYTKGVNAYISQMSDADLPLEYRLLNYRPEEWTTLKTALFLKYMSYDLTGYETDIEYTNARSFFSEEDFNKLYPAMADSVSPIITAGTKFPTPASVPAIPASADTQYLRFNAYNIQGSKTDKDNGSNNWAVSGSKTRSGRPILCNDPHLGLNLPSLWYEIQVTTPAFNVYGVSFPGSPGVIIGFNDSIAWGVTNGARDVRDYYEIRFKDAGRHEYLYNGEWRKSDIMVEKYQMKDGSAYYDTIVHTLFGPVMYDAHFTGTHRAENYHNLAVRWKAHDPSNELKTFSLLNRARNYSDYQEAINHFSCPGQNFVFASKDGDIAMWHQGAFPAKWYRQGDFVMPGWDSSYLWQGDIPFAENPHEINPARGFVSSANQAPADSTYPYYLGGHFDLYRGYQINRRLTAMNGIIPQDMQRLQFDNFNPLAEEALPLMLGRVNTAVLNTGEIAYLQVLERWNMKNDNGEKAATMFSLWFESLEKAVWNDELAQVNGPYMRPEAFTLIQALKKDSAFSFIDNINTPARETLADMLTASFREAVAQFRELELIGKLEWWKYKDAGVRHLLRLEPFSRLHLNTGGGQHIINATKQFHGPSWKMVVHLTDQTEAYGIYPGGQSGNPGSRYYDPFVNDWTEGRHYRLWIMKRTDASNQKTQFHMRFNKMVVKQ